MCSLAPHELRFSNFHLFRFFFEVALSVHPLEILGRKACIHCLSQASPQHGFLRVKRSPGVAECGVTFWGKGCGNWKVFPSGFSYQELPARPSRVVWVRPSLLMEGWTRATPTLQWPLPVFVGRGPVPLHFYITRMNQIDN